MSLNINPHPRRSIHIWSFLTTKALWPVAILLVDVSFRQKLSIQQKTDSSCSFKIICWGGCQGSLHYQRKQCTTIREIPQDYHEFGLGPIKWPLLYSCNPLSAIEGNQTSAIRHQVYNDWNQNGFPTLLGSVNFPCAWHVDRPATSVHWMNTFIVARESQWSPGSWGKSRVWKVPKWK